MNSPTHKRRLSRWTLVLVAVMFLSPFIVALILNRTGWHPDATRNHGELIEPPEALGDLALTGVDGQSLPLANLDHRWTWLVRVPGQCDHACIERLDEIHRVRRSLHRHAPRLVIRLIAAEPSSLPELPPDLRPLSNASIDALNAAAPRIALAPDWTGFLVDDKAYLMLHFPPELEARLIRRDLGRLIR